jgi:hypothetical protein
MTAKEEMLNGLITELIKNNPNENYLSLDEIKLSKEYAMSLVAMEEYAKQECAEKEEEIKRLKGLLEKEVTQTGGIWRNYCLNNQVEYL